MRAISLDGRCVSCMGSGKGPKMWTSSDTSLEPPAWVAAMPYPACPACGGTGVESHPLPLYVHPAPNELEQAVHALTFDMETVKRETALAFDVLADVELLAAAAMEPCTNRWCPDCRFGEADHDEGVAQGCTRALADLECACWMHKHEEHRLPQCRLRAALRTVCAIMEEM